MSLFLDGVDPLRIYLGTQSVQYVYLGQTLIWPAEIDSCRADPLIDGSGNIISAVYQDFAARYDQEEVLVWRFGPGYKCYHPEPEVIPELPQPAGIDEDGISGPGPHALAAPNGGTSGWWGTHGQMAYVPDLPFDPGMAGVATDGLLYPHYPGPEKLEEDHVYDFNARWEHGPNFYNYLPYVFGNNPDLTLRADVGGWDSLSRPVAVARSKNTSHVTGVAIFKNGYVVHTPTAHSTHIKPYMGAPYAAMQLPAGKVPTGVALTLNSEFTLVTIWDTDTEQGQLAIIANEGNPPGNCTTLPYFIGDTWLWGIPQWPYIRNFKLLGFIDLPMKAPTIVDSVGDRTLWTGRGNQENNYLDLNLQVERDWWFIENGALFKKVSRAGYAIVASRSENKVCFIDLQPLHQYYLTRYFTTQANYDSTKNVGPAPNQWPHTFSFAPVQTPVIVQTITVPKPTAVHCGSGVVDGNNIGVVGRNMEDGFIAPPVRVGLAAPQGFFTFKGDISISELHAQTPSRSLRMRTIVDESGIGAGDAFAGLFHGGFGRTQLTLTFGFYIAMLPTGGHNPYGQMFVNFARNFNLASLYIDSTGIVRVIDHHNVLHGISTTALEVGQWYNLEVMYKPGTIIEFKINGVSEFIASWTPYPGDIMDLNIVYMCSALGGHATDWYFDNVWYFSFDILYTEPLGVAKRRAFIATQDDGLLVYDIRNLNKEDLTGPKLSPRLEDVIDVGNNPSVICNSHEQPQYGNYFYVLARGDNTVYEIDGHSIVDAVQYNDEAIEYNNEKVAYTHGAGFITSSFRDSRMVDPCHIHGSTGRQYSGILYGSIHVMDFNGKMIRHYIRWINASTGEGFIKIEDPQWYHGRSNEVPGKPFMLTLGEII